jgi:hypothetical protein
VRVRARRCGAIKQRGVRPGRVWLKLLGERPAGGVLGLERADEVGQQRRGPVMRLGVGGDAGLGVGAARCAVEGGQLASGEALAEEQLDELGEEQDPLIQRAGVAVAWEVERVEGRGVGAGERRGRCRRRRRTAAGTRPRDR